MPRRKTLVLLLAILLPGCAMPESGGSNGGALKENDPGHYAHQIVRHLSQEIGPRIAGSDAEARAGDYILREFDRLGLEAEKQPFTYQDPVNGDSVSSANIVASKKGTSPRVVYIGAHYDSADIGAGTDDNASGVGVLLEAARAVSDAETPYTLKFLAFGAEEVGLVGSQYYVSQMTQEEVDNAVAMINLDSLVAGDHMHIYGSEGEDGFVRELGLEIAAKLSLDVTTQPGLNPDIPAGTTIDASDHAPFKYAGIPYGYLEATNWTLGR